MKNRLIYIILIVLAIPYYVIGGFIWAITGKMPYEKLCETIFDNQTALVFNRWGKRERILEKMLLESTQVTQSQKNTYKRLKSLDDKKSMLNDYDSDRRYRSVKAFNQREYK